MWAYKPFFFPLLITEENQYDLYLTFVWPSQIDLLPHICISILLIRFFVPI